MKNTLKVISKLILFITFTLCIISCTIRKRRSLYAEMPEKPVVLIEDNKLTVMLSNSMLNSAVANYKVKHKIDILKKEVSIWGYKALVNKKSKDTFELKAIGLNKTDLEKYNYYWIDPDNKSYKMEIKNK